MSMYALRSGVVLLLMGLLAGEILVEAQAPQKVRETPAAQATRKRLQNKISIEWDNVPLKVALEDIRNELDSKVSFKIDNASGVSNNTKVKLKADNVPAAKVLNDLCDRYDLGYFVLSRPNDRYDGWIIIRKSKERGYENKTEGK